MHNIIYRQIVHKWWYLSCFQTWQLNFVCSLKIIGGVENELQRVVHILLMSVVVVVNVSTNTV